MDNVVWLWGGFTLFIGRNNLDVFSRIASSDPARMWTGGGPRNTTTRSTLGGPIESRLRASSSIRCGLRNSAAWICSESCSRVSSRRGFD